MFVCFFVSQILQKDNWFFFQFGDFFVEVVGVILKFFVNKKRNIQYFVEMYKKIFIIFFNRIYIVDFLQFNEVNIILSYNNIYVLLRLFCIKKKGVCYFIEKFLVIDEIN